MEEKIAANILGAIRGYLKKPLNKATFKNTTKGGKAASGPEVLEHLPFGDKIKSSRPLTVEEKEAWKSRRISEYGTNSFLDLPIQAGKWVGKKLAPNKITDEGYAKFLGKYQKPLLEGDKVLGEKLKNIPLVGKAFRTVDEVPAVMHTTEKGKEFVGTTRAEGYRATAPIDKAKKVAMPVLGILGVQQLAETMQQGKQREGDALVQENNHVAVDQKELIEKVSEIMNTRFIEKNAALEKAAGMLKRAAEKIDYLEEELNKVAEDNKRMTLQLIAKERSRKSVKLANDMLLKGLIKRAHINTEVDRIMDMDDNSFSILERTVKNASIESINDPNKLDKLSGIMDYNNSSTKKSFKDALLE